jgi:hypothetical protein
MNNRSNKVNSVTNGGEISFVLDGETSHSICTQHAVYLSLAVLEDVLGAVVNLDQSIVSKWPWKLFTLRLIFVLPLSAQV